MALPVRLGGLGVINPLNQAHFQYCTSSSVTGPLTLLILQQSHTYPHEVVAEQCVACSDAKNLCRDIEKRLFNKTASDIPLGELC